MTLLEHHIDPDPDTVIVLRSPCVVFAPWDEAPSGEDATLDDNQTPASINELGDGWGASIWGNSKKGKKVGKKGKKGKGKLCEPRILSNEDEVIRDVHTLAGKEPEDVTGEPSTLAQAQELTHFAADPVISYDQEEPEGSIRYYVSSRHLVLASPWFRRALAKQSWAESGRNVKDGLIHIKTDDWDSNAFLIVLNIIHLKNRNVPREVSLDDLAKIAVIVDYYECAEAVELFTDMWKGNTTDVFPVPSTYCRTLTLWIWIAWVFDWEEQFSSATLVAIKQCSEPMRSLGLPIPERVTDRIDLERYKAMEDIVEGLHDLREKHLDLNYECPQYSASSFICGSTLYGAISKGMLAIHILSPRPQIPFTGMSFEKLCNDVRNFVIPSTDEYCSVYYREDFCNHTTVVTTVVDNILSNVGGFQLQSLKND